MKYGVISGGKKLDLLLFDTGKLLNVKKKKLLRLFLTVGTYILPH